MHIRSLSVVFMLFLVSCASGIKIEMIRSGGIMPSLEPVDDLPPREISIEHDSCDTLIVTDSDGREMFLMPVIEDDDGELTASGTLNAAIKIASFKNVAERHGKVDLRFSIIVPSEMQDGKWQLRFMPELYVMGDTLMLDRIFITGDMFRRQQLRGYEQYERFMSTVITDSTEFIRKRALGIFVERNAVELDCPYSGISESDAVSHYTDRLREWMNVQRFQRKDRMFRRFVKSPIIKDGIRLDSIVRNGNGDWRYEYVQTINTVPGLRKAQIVLSGSVNDIEREILKLPLTEPLSFYISSLSSLTDDSVKYRTKVISRRVSERFSCKIEFSAGKAEIDRSLGMNDHQLNDLDFRLRTLLDNHELEIDSILVCASASPEGSYEFNRKLSQKRGMSMCGFMDGIMDNYLDSVRREEGVRLSLTDMVRDDSLTAAPDFHFRPDVRAENWDLLKQMVLDDGYLTDAEKQEFNDLMSEADEDIREQKMVSRIWFPYVRESLYPELRVVDINVHMHRRNMVQDTIMTMEPDSTYLRGVQMIRDREYKEAISVLRPYADYNAAVAYMALDYNASAMEILTSLPGTASVEYLLAILYSRQGKEREALQSYLNAIGKETSFIHRGNLDPEISSLIKKYQPNIY